MARCGCGGTSCGCALVAGDNVAVSGTGSAANPFVISSSVPCSAVRPCLSAGTGITYSSATGVIAADFSAIPCSVIRPCLSAGTGITYSSATGQISADFSAVPCTAVRPCLSAGNGASYNSGTGVVTARLSPQAGNNIVFAPDGGLFVPTGAATVTTGCGLTGNGSAGSPVKAVTSAWGYACDLDAQAGKVYCDSSGALRSEPPPTLTYTETAVTTTFSHAAVPTGTSGTAVHTDNLTITNPDPCRAATVVYEAEVDIDYDLPVGGGAAAGISTDEMQYFINRGSATINDVHWQVTKVQRRTIPAGGTLVEPIVVTMSRGSAGAAYNRIQTQQRAWVFAM